jgi:hypothetical protein
MKHLMPNDPRHEISRSTGGHFKRRHKRSPHRSRDVPLRLRCQHSAPSISLYVQYSNPELTDMVLIYGETLSNADTTRRLYVGS